MKCLCSYRSLHWYGLPWGEMSDQCCCLRSKHGSDHCPLSPFSPSWGEMSDQCCCLRSKHGSDHCPLSPFSPSWGEMSDQCCCLQSKHGSDHCPLSPFSPSWKSLCSEAFHIPQPPSKMFMRSIRQYILSIYVYAKYILLASIRLHTLPMYYAVPNNSRIKVDNSNHN